MSTPTPQHDAWVHSALGVNPADFASPPPAGPNGGGSTQDHTAECDRFLKDHHFNATKSEEIVPGDMQCDLWLDDHLVKRQDVQAALTQAIPALQNDPIWVAHYVADHWDQEIKKALLQSGALLLQPAELYDTGYQAGLAGAMQICPRTPTRRGKPRTTRATRTGKRTGHEPPCVIGSCARCRTTTRRRTTC